jgi:flagellar basal body-associated protein FliL
MGQLRRAPAALREREVEMANKKSGKRGSGIIALIAVVAALAGGPSAASASPGKSKAPQNASAPAVVPAWYVAPSLEASWAE